MRIAPYLWFDTQAEEAALSNGGDAATQGRHSR